MKRWVFLLIIMGLSPLMGADESKTIRSIQLKNEGRHDTGKMGARGWQVDYRNDRPGYILAGLESPLLLEPGFYRVTFHLRRGHYPKKGLLYPAYGLFRLELWDTTLNERIAERELQIVDLARPDHYEPRWIEFSMAGRDGHVIEPRVYWIGLANGELESVEVNRFPDVSPNDLERKAERLTDHLLKRHLENGFVVSRKPDGEADETGDATTYTGFYVASLAWKYQVTKDEMTLQALENGLMALHNAVKGTRDEPLITRFVDEDGTPFSKNPSKDVYTSFFLAHSVAYPLITNPALKKQMRQDIERVATKFLQDDLQIKSGQISLTSLTPYLTEDQILFGIRKLFSDPKRLKKFIKNLRLSKRFLPFGELWPGMKEVIKALEKKDEKRLMELVIPTINGTFDLMERVRDILREQYRQDLFPKRFTNKEYPGIKLANILSTTLKHFPKNVDGQRVQELSDVKILASNSLIALHIIKTAEEITGASQFKEYYRANLYGQDALLKTAVDWWGMEDELLRLTAGNPTADEDRRGYLGALSLMNLIALEENKATKETYMSLLSREWKSYRNEGNPMSAAFNLVSSNGKDGSVEEIMRGLFLYPENREGFGKEYWNANGKDIAQAVGGGEKDGNSREPLPVDYRPKDSFLWQRNPRRLEGDFVKDYPATDFLFVYWYCRAHNLLPASDPESTVHR